MKRSFWSQPYYSNLVWRIAGLVKHCPKLVTVVLSLDISSTPEVSSHSVQTLGQHYALSSFLQEIIYLIGLLKCLKKFHFMFGSFYTEESIPTTTEVEIHRAIKAVKEVLNGNTEERRLSVVCNWFRRNWIPHLRRLCFWSEILGKKILKTGRITLIINRRGLFGISLTVQYLFKFLLIRFHNWALSWLFSDTNILSGLIVPERCCDQIFPTLGFLPSTLHKCPSNIHLKPPQHSIHFHSMF